MNDLNIPTKTKEKICSQCLRRLPVKYFLIDGSRSDGFACNCCSCLFPSCEKYQERFPELWDQDKFEKVDQAEIPVLNRGIQSAREALAKKKALRIRETGVLDAFRAQNDQWT